MIWAKVHQIFETSPQTHSKCVVPNRIQLFLSKTSLGLFYAFILFNTAALAGPFGSKAITLFGSYGYEKKYDIYPGLTDSANYFGGFININELFEGQVFITTGSNDSKNHYSANFHHAFFKMLQPFVNLGLGYMASGGTHLNFDVGLQLAVERIRLRVFYKSQNKMWGETKFGDAAMMFAAGLTL